MSSVIPDTTILLPNFKTPELTRLCLRSLRKHTDMNRVKVLVIDNGSNDSSLDYLRSLSWIELFERTPSPSEAPAQMHTIAMDILAEKVDTEFMLSFHTDTIVTSDEWLDFLIKRIKRSDNIAGVGSWKLEFKPAYEVFFHQIEDNFRRLFFSLTGRNDRKTGERFLRSHCALYRTELFRRHTRGFGNGQTAGQSCHNMLVEAGFEMEFIPENLLSKHMLHLNHATMILNPETGGRKTSTAKARQKLQSGLDAAEFQAILADDSYDK